MNFRDSFYYIDSSCFEDGVQTYSIRLNPEHAIYAAHFPGDPITPGVCILQTAFELLSLATGRKLEIINLKNVKFLSILRPDGDAVNVKVNSHEIDCSCIKAQIDFSRCSNQIAKISMTCQIVL